MALTFDRFLLFGDSLIQWADSNPDFSFTGRLLDAYTRKLDILKRGFYGYNSRWALPVFKQILEVEGKAPGKIRLACIFLGTNDSLNTFEHVPLHEYKLNLTAMVKLALEHEIRVIIVGPTLHDQELGLQHFGSGGDQPFTSSQITREYADAAWEVALDHKLPFLDLWYLFQKDGGWSSSELLHGTPDLSEYLHDGFHFTARAYKVFYDALLALIKREYPDLHPENIPFHLPPWDRIDQENYEESILGHNTN